MDPYLPYVTSNFRFEVVYNHPGAASVVLTDKDTRPAQMNLKQNSHNVAGCNITVSTLEWGNEVSAYDPPFDVILGADVVYIEDVFTKLAKTLDDLSNSDSVILLCCKHRYDRDDRFFQQLLDSGKFTDDIIKIWDGNIKLHKLQKIHWN